MPKEKMAAQAAIACSVYSNREVCMHSVRGKVRLLKPVACAALLAIVGCAVPPFAFHDGLPAWTMPAGKVEGNIGYHRMYWHVPADTSSWYPMAIDSSFWYLTPGVRYGLARPPLAAEVGVTSVIMQREVYEFDSLGMPMPDSKGTYEAMFGPMLGIGYRTPSFCLVARPSLYLIAITEDTIYTKDLRFLRDAYFQLSLLAGNGFKPGRFNFSGGCRISDYGMGPVVLVDKGLGPVSLRLEGSYIFPRGSQSDGQLLSFGLSVAGPALQSDDNWGTWGY
jgi:hypothetical protein